MELEVARVHADVCDMGGQSQDRTSAQCWGTCLALHTARSKRKENNGAGNLLLRNPFQEQCCNRALKRSTAYLRTAGFLFGGVCFVVWVLFKITLWSEKVI